MKPPMGLLAGPKFSNRHSTVVSAAVPVIKAVRDRPDVSKVVLSEIKRLRPGPTRIKVQHIPAGLRLVVRGMNAQQELFVYTSAPKAVEQAVLNA